MTLMLIFCKFCLVALSIQILKINSVSAYVFREIKFSFPSTNFTLQDYFPDFKSFIGVKKHIVSTIDKLASNLYKIYNSFIQNSDDILSHFKLHKVSWNWTRVHPEFPCSEFNISDFNFHIENDLFGQHIISCYLPQLLKDHLIKSKPVKPLLISFQGSTGSGKSFVSKMIVESLFQEGFKSKFVHTYYGSRDFFHAKEKDSYRKRLLQEIPFLLSLCDRPVFIFEEMDKIVPGVLDVILPFIFFNENSSEVFSANSIFIFISNSGSERIEEIFYDAWLEGVPREDITLTKFSFLKAAIYNKPGGLQYSEIIKRNLIDIFLPFLPLEKEHVKQCVLRELYLRNLSLNKKIVEYIANQITYHPPEFELFAESGCKRISQKVDLYGEIDL